MQFAETLSREEVNAVSRFVDTFEAQYALEEGFQVVSLAKTLELGGFDVRWKQGRANFSMFGTRKDEPAESFRVPKLAVAPHAFPSINLLMWGSTYDFTDGSSSAWGSRASTFSRAIRPSWAITPTPGEYSIWFSSRLPPLPREARKAIEDYPNSLVLWEADWQQHTAPVGDPAILVPLIEDLYAVAYTWDLTETERNALIKSAAR